MIQSFQKLGISDKILSAIGELDYEHPMPIQEKIIPLLLQEKLKDIIGLAQTGTGKTAAFGLPIIQKTDQSKNFIQYLILSPTRELCVQIADDLISYAKFSPGVKITAVFGGASMEKQIKKIKSGVQIISATPGRLLDLLNRQVVDLSKIKTLVLDEADEMLNMGFREDLESILQQTPREKNTLLFSATMPNEVLSIAKKYLKDPIEVSVGKRNAGAENINHICYMVHAKDRYLALKRIADYYPSIYGIIFCRTRQETKDVAENLMKDGYDADALHGDLSQPQRDYVMNKFRNKHLSLLVATDVAARGIDVDNLTHIINYNLPDELELYTHRSGRTGRAGRFGTSILIANLKEKNKIHQIEKSINNKFKFLPVPNGKEICEKQLFHLIDKMEKVEVDDSQIQSYLPLIFQKLEWLEREELIKKFVSVEFNRFLEYYKNSPDLNVPEQSPKTKGKKDFVSYQDDAFTRFFINLGRLDDFQPTNLIGLINDNTNVRNIRIGKIEILKSFSFFEADGEFADLIIKSLKNKKFKNRQITIELAEKKKKNQNESFGQPKKRKVREEKPRKNRNRRR